MTRSALGDLTLLRRHLLAGARTSLLLAVLVAITVAGVAIGPRMLARLGDRELRHALAETTPTQLDVAGLGRLGIADAPDADPVGPADLAIRGVPSGLPQPLRGLVGDPHWLVRSEPNTAIAPRAHDVSVDLQLGVDPSWEDSLTVVDGALPTAYDGHGTIGVAVPQALADRLALRTGDRIGYSPADLRVTAVVEVKDPDGRYAAHTAGLVMPTVEEADGVVPTVSGTVLVDPASAGALQNMLVAGTVTVWFPVDASGVSYADSGEVQSQARRLATNPVELPYGGGLSLRTGMADVIEQTDGRISATYALLALAFSGLAGVLVAVFSLAVGTLATRRRRAISLAYARGASQLQVRGLMVIEGLIIAVPASVLALVAVSMALPADVGPAGVVLPFLTAMLVPFLLAVMSGPRSVREPRPDLALRHRSRVRWVLEVGAVALAALSLLVLARRGLIESSKAVGIDPLVVGAPIFLAVAVCVIVLRLYPVPLLLLHRRLRSRGGPVAFMGTARSVRGPALGFAAALAMVVGMSVVTFSVAMATTVRSGLEQSVREDVGADVRLSSEGFGAGDLEAVRRTPGVRAAAALTVQLDQELDAGGPTQVDVVVADTVALHEVRPDLPSLARTEGGEIPLLLGTDRQDASGEVLLADTPAVVVATVDSAILPGLGSRWVLVDESAVPSGIAVGEPQQLLLRADPGIDVAELAQRTGAVVRGAPDLAGTDVETRLAVARSSPVVGSLQPALLVAALVALVLTLLTVVLASLNSAHARQEMIGVLRILGMTRRQVHGLVAWELAPIAVVAVAVGTVLGLALPWIVTGVLDLRPFVGGRTPPDPVVEPLTVVAGVGVFVAGVACAGLLAAAISRRVAPAETIKMGEQ